MNRLRSLLIALAILLLASTASAQQTNMKVNVPFDFFVGEQVYPAGEYTLRSMAGNDAMIRIDGRSEVRSAMLPSNPCAVRQRSEQTKLVFHRFGDSYFLYQAWIAGNRDGRQFSASHTQRQLAQNIHNGDTVVVAARSIK